MTQRRFPIDGLRAHAAPIVIGMVLLAAWVVSLFFIIHRPPPEQRAFRPEYHCRHIGRGAAEICERQAFPPEGRVGKVVSKPPETAE